MDEIAGLIPCYNESKMIKVLFVCHGNILATL